MGVVRRPKPKVVIEPQNCLTITIKLEHAVKYWKLNEKSVALGRPSMELNAGYDEYSTFVLSFYSYGNRPTLDSIGRLQVFSLLAEKYPHFKISKYGFNKLLHRGGYFCRAGAKAKGVTESSVYDIDIKEDTIYRVGS